MVFRQEAERFSPPPHISVSDPPKQFSSGGKVNLVGISRRVANRRLRAVLIQGARAYVYHMKEPKTAKDRWLWAIVERSGKCKAAVALANKNARIIWALMATGETYRTQTA